MSLILSFDTAQEKALVCLSESDKMVASAENSQRSDHASWLHTTIQSLFRDADRSLKQLDAVAVTNGPGSFTGLRVGMAAAKGFCYALGIPLITLGTLELMARGAREQARDLICPLIDARRMEVYAALFDKDLSEKMPPQAMILDKNSFDSILAVSPILFFGSGSAKLKSILVHENAEFGEIGITPYLLADFALNCFKKKKFSELAYSEPLYLKDFYSTAP